MAGDWIKMRSSLDSCPEVFQLAHILNLDELSIVGRLWKVWTWADQHTISGNAIIVTNVTLDRVTCTPGFADALRKVGWLEGRDGLLSFPNFERHNGQTAKNRALTKDRVRKKRNDNVTQPPLPEKRREEKSNNTPIVPKGTFETFWSAYPKKVGKKAAERRWKALKPDIQQCLHALEVQRKTEQWRKDGGQFIPNPATWLHQGRWDDAPKIELVKRTPQGIPQCPQGWAQWRDDTYPGADKIPFIQATREIQKEFEQSTKEQAA